MYLLHEYIHCQTLNIAYRVSKNVYLLQEYIIMKLVTSHNMYQRTCISYTKTFININEQTICTK